MNEALFRIKAPRTEQRERRFLSWEQVEELALNTVEPYGNLIRFAALTGLRQGELFALTDDCVDWDAARSRSREVFTRLSKYR